MKLFRCQMSDKAGDVYVVTTDIEHVARIVHEAQKGASLVVSPSHIEEIDAAILCDDAVKILTVKR